MARGPRGSNDQMYNSAASAKNKTKHVIYCGLKTRRGATRLGAVSNWFKDPATDAHDNDDHVASGE